MPVTRSEPPEKRGGLSVQELAQDVGEDTAMAVVLHFDGRVDAEGDVESSYLA